MIKYVNAKFYYSAKILEQDYYEVVLGNNLQATACFFSLHCIVCKI